MPPPRHTEAAGTASARATWTRAPPSSISAPSDDWCIMGSAYANAITYGYVAADQRHQVLRHDRAGTPARCNTSARAAAECSRGTTGSMHRAACRRHTSSNGECAFHLHGISSLVEVPGPADVHAESDQAAEVRHEAGENRRAHDAVQLPAEEDPRRDADREPAGSQTGQHHRVEGLPDAPGVDVVHPADGAQPGPLAVDAEDDRQARPSRKGT